MKTPTREQVQEAVNDAMLTTGPRAYAVTDAIMKLFTPNPLTPNPLTPDENTPVGTLIEVWDLGANDKSIEEFAEIIKGKYWTSDGNEWNHARILTGFFGIPNTGVCPWEEGTEVDIKFSKSIIRTAGASFYNWSLDDAEPIISSCEVKDAD